MLPEKITFYNSIINNNMRRTYLSNQRTLVKIALLTGIVITLVATGLTIGLELLDQNPSPSTGSDNSDFSFHALLPALFFPAFFTPIIALQLKKKQEAQLQSNEG